MLAFCANPVLKWAGGKQAIAETLVRCFPKSFDRYYEPFIGGGSVFFTAFPQQAIMGDENEWLLDTYEALRMDYVRVAEILEGMTNTKEEFLRVRKVCPKDLDVFHRAAHLIYLNKTCFRGLFRVNRRGEFNVPYGAYDRRYFDLENLKTVAAALANVEIRRGDFELTLQDISRGDFAYMDPPYHKLGGYSDFNRYTKTQFRENDHFRLAALCRELDGRGVAWAVSNSDTDFVRKLFRGYRQVAINNRREINLKSQDRDIQELLITNYE